MAEKGWIKLHRQLQDCPLWYCERFSKGQAWVDLLLMANHSDKKIVFNGQMMVVKRGQYLTSMLKLAEKWQWDRKTVKSFLSLLSRDKMISVETDNHKTLITIENYSIFQMCDSDDMDNGTDTEITNGADNSTDTTLDTNNNVKNYKNDKNEGEYTRTHEEVDFDAIWKYTFDAYPKKSNHASAKVEWMTRLAEVVEPNRKAVATMIWEAMQLYFKDYKENNQDDTNYRFVPTFNKWLTEDLDYWLAEVQRRNENG